MKIAIASADRVRVEALRRVVIEPMRWIGSGHEVIWTAHDGAGAIEQCAGARPDILLLDVDLPGLGCVEVTRRVMSASPCGILLVSRSRVDSASPAEVESIFEAMGAGAQEVVPSPWIEADGGLTGGVAVAERLRVLEWLARFGDVRPQSVPALVEASRSRGVLVAVGASSGGPKSLRILLRGLSRDLPAALLIMQNIEPGYAAGLASWLAQQTEFPVKLATPGAPLVAGTALLAPASARLVVTPDNTVEPSDEAPEGSLSPGKYNYAEKSMDEFFHGLVRHTPPGIAVLLNNLRHYEAQGMLCRAGWLTIREGTLPGSHAFDKPATDPQPEVPALVLPIEAIAPTVAATVARMRP